MKKLNKFVAVLVALAMMSMLAVVTAFADDPEANTVDFAVTKQLKVPTGTAIPANTTVDVVFNNTKIDSVAPTDDTYSDTVTLTLTEAKADVKNGDGATTYYYYTTGNMLEKLGLKTAPAGVYAYEISEANYKVGGVAYDEYADGNATIENGGTYKLTVAKTINNTYSITASKENNKVEVKDVKDDEHDASITGNGLMLVNTYYEDGSGDDFEHSTLKATKDVTNDNGLYTPGDTFAMTATLDVPDIEAAEAEVYIRHYNYNADTQQPADTLVTFTDGTAEVNLAKGDYLYVIKAPTGTLLSLEETDARASETAGEAMYRKSGEFENAAVSKTAQTKTITNDYQTTTTEGILISNLPYIVLALVAVGGLVAYVVVRRKADEA